MYWHQSKASSWRSEEGSDAPWSKAVAVPSSAWCPALAPPAPRCFLPAATRHLLLAQHPGKDGISASLRLQSCAQEAAWELGIPDEMGSFLSVCPSMHAQTAGLEQGRLLPAVAAAPCAGKAGGA